MHDQTQQNQVGVSNYKSNNNRSKNLIIKAKEEKIGQELLESYRGVVTACKVGPIVRELQQNPHSGESDTRGSSSVGDEPLSLLLPVLRNILQDETLNNFITLNIKDVH